MRSTPGSLILAGAAMVAALAVSPALAQPPGGPGGRDPKAMAERQLEDLKPRLKLTAEQQPKVRAILEDNATRMGELRDKHRVERGQPPSEEARKAIDLLRKETRDALAGVLTPEQIAEYDKWAAERGPGRGRRPGGAS